MFVKTLKSNLTKIVLATGMLAATMIALPKPASADTGSTIAIAAAAAAIVGAIAYDSQGRPYYMRDRQRFYVSQDTANYWRFHRNDRFGRHRRPH